MSLPFHQFFCLFDTLYPVKGSVHCPNHCRHLAHNLNRIEDGKGSDQNNGEISERQVAANSEDSRAQHNHAGRNTEHHRIGHIERGKYTLHPIRGSRIALIGIFNIAQILSHILKDFTTEIPCTYSNVAATASDWIFCRFAESAFPFFCMWL